MAAKENPGAGTPGQEDIRQNNRALSRIGRARRQGKYGRARPSPRLLGLANRWLAPRRVTR
jgi:hypothetical protein